MGLGAFVLELVIAYRRQENSSSIVAGLCGGVIGAGAASGAPTAEKVERHGRNINLGY